VRRRQRVPGRPPQRQRSEARMTADMDGRQLRTRLLDALKAAATLDGLDEAARLAFVERGEPFSLSRLDMDSLARMEFCIAVELSLGVTLLPRQLLELDSIDAIERFVAERLT
jgi:acyl carrier protein